MLRPTKEKSSPGGPPSHRAVRRRGGAQSSGSFSAGLMLMAVAFCLTFSLIYISGAGWLKSIGIGSETAGRTNATPKVKLSASTKLSGTPLERIASGQLNLIKLSGDKGTFCTLDFKTHKSDPSTYPMFRYEGLWGVLHSSTHNF